MKPTQLGGLQIVIRHQDGVLGVQDLLSTLASSPLAERVSICVADDGSIPSQADLCETLIQKEKLWWGLRLDWLRSPLRRGPQSTFSAAMIVHAQKVEWVLCLDSTLRLGRDFLEGLFQFLETHADPFQIYSLPRYFGSKSVKAPPDSWIGILMSPIILKELDWDRESLEWVVGSQPRVMLEKPRVLISVDSAPTWKDFFT
jgi:hypothetical protein